jgi:hypothetical protein
VIEKPDKQEWGWKVLWDDDHKFTRKVSINAELDGTNKLKGFARISSYDYEKLSLLKTYKKGKKELEQSNISEDGIIIDSFEVADAEVDSMPLQQTFNFTGPVSSSGEYHYFSANLFAGLSKNPFMADERSTDIFFGARQDYSVNSVIFLPDGYGMDELPKNVRLISADTSIIFTRHSAFSEGMLNVQYSIKFNNPFYTVEEYPALKDFYKKLYAMLGEKFVYRKNK